MQLIGQVQRILRRYQHYAAFRLLVLVSLVIILVFLMVESVSTNQVQTTDIDRDMVIRATLDSLADQIGIEYDSELDYEQRAVRQNTSLINEVRWPRVAMAVLVGAALGLAGSVLQGVFRNPLADPGLIGVSSGAAVGAITAILIGVDLTSALETLPDLGILDPANLSGLKFAQALAAFAVGLMVTLLVYRLSRLGGRTDTANLLLIGLAVNSISGAYVGVATFIGDEQQTSDIIFWSLGSVAGVFWEDVYLAAPFVLTGVVILPTLARQLNVMTLGEAEARTLGINTERLRQITVGLSALMVGVAVGFAGIIGFIGLVVPHLMRLLFGPDHRLILPGSVISGAIFLVAADMFGRTIPNPSTAGIAVEVPVGILTALVGGPFFLFLVLLHQSRRKLT
ncbi:MAG: iron ABC transporter permease [Chloroflexi bacterium]|nr:iron ABC transporter permease [Chloroflexota bacterium]